MQPRRTITRLLVCAAVVLMLAPLALADPPDAGAPPTEAPPAQCNEQAARPELIRSNYIPVGGDADAERARHTLRTGALRFRTEHYGYFDGFGEPAWNANPPSHYAEWSRFMGLRVQLNRSVWPAVHCVEREIVRACAAHPYRPAHLVGIRPNNSFRGGEVSNHVYGIALDIDADRNPCCGCGGHFAEHPACHRAVHSPYDRTEIPECWIHAFERYGFYWLGNDRGLRDTMHFEFLGDPDRVVARP